MAKAYIGLGSNLGDREQHISDALSKLHGIKQVSALYETAPLYNTKQPMFLNCVAEVETALSPHELFTALRTIEQQLGRKRAEKNAPRVIDLDLLLYDDVVLEGELVLPHPGIPERLFVLEPLVELCPEKRHPVLQKRLGELHALLQTEQQVRLYHPTNPDLHQYFSSS